MLACGYLSGGGGPQSRQLGSRSRRCWRRTSSGPSSCCPWRPARPAAPSHRSGPASGRRRARCTRPRSHSDTGCHSPGRWSGRRGRPPDQWGPGGRSYHAVTHPIRHLDRYLVGGGAWTTLHTGPGPGPGLHLTLDLYYTSHWTCTTPHTGPGPGPGLHLTLDLDLDLDYT